MATQAEKDRPTVLVVEDEVIVALDLSDSIQHTDGERGSGVP